MLMAIMRLYAFRCKSTIRLHSSHCTKLMCLAPLCSTVLTSNTLTNPYIASFSKSIRNESDNETATLSNEDVLRSSDERKSSKETEDFNETKVS